MIKIDRKPVKLAAEQLRNGEWVVRPAGACGTIGWTPHPWEAFFCKAPTAAS